MTPHKHLLVRAQISNPISDPDQISIWISTLVETIQMKILHGPVSVYCKKEGNRGITGFAIIETSHIVLHTWDEESPAMLQLDVYTCSNLDIDLVFGALSVFEPIKIDYKFLDREHSFTEIIETPEQVVKKWVARISKNHADLGGHRICPFARMPQVVAVEKLSLDKFADLDDEITVFMETGVCSTYDELENLCRQLKSINPNYVFLPDHPHKPNYIKGHETGNRVYPCIIAQTKQELDSARASLSKTNYYDNWDKDYLAEIRSFD